MPEIVQAIQAAKAPATDVPFDPTATLGSRANPVGPDQENQGAQ